MFFDVDQLLQSTVKALEADPSLAARLAEALGVKSAAEGSAHCTIDAFAREVGVSNFTVRCLIKEGLPHVPVGHLIRIDRAEALKWLRARGRRGVTPSTKTLSSKDLALTKEATKAARGAGLKIVKGGRNGHKKDRDH